MRRVVRVRGSLDQVVGHPSQFDVATHQSSPSFVFSVAGAAALLRQELHAFAIEQNFDLNHASVHFYRELRVGAEDSEATLTYHANPNVEGEPWFDDVLILEASVPRVVFSLVRLLAFVVVVVEEEDEPQEYMMAFGHAFCAPGTQRHGNNGGPVFDVYAPESRVAGYVAGAPSASGRYKTARIPARVTLPHFPMMQLTAPPVVRLVETESISSGVWTNPNLDQPDVYWVFREPASANERYDGDVEEEQEEEKVLSDLSSDDDNVVASSEEDEDSV